MLLNTRVSTSYSRTKDSDIKRAIKSALAIPITDWGSLKDIRYLNIDDFKFADNQLLLSKWYFNQHRYSQAICTATECFRSYTTVIYSPLKYKIQNDQQKFDRIIDEDFRRIAIQKFIDNNQLLNNIEKNIPKVGRLCKDISEYYKNKAVKVRNVCAHNLMTNENNISENGIEIIGHFLDLLENFRNCLNNNYNMKVIRMAYTTKLSSNGKPKCLFIYDKKIDSNILQKKVDTLYIKNEKVVALQDGILSDINEKEKFCLELNYIIQQESAMEDEPNQFRVVFDSSIKQEIVINTVLLQKNNLNCTIFQMGNTEPFSYFMQEYSLYFDNDTESIKFIPINYAFTKLTRSNPETSNNEKTITDKNQYIKQGNKTAKQNEKKDLTPSYPQYCSVETIKKLVNKLNIKIITESDTKNAIDFDELERFEFINSLENYAIKYDSVNKINMDFRCDFKTYTVLNYDNINNIKTLKEICVKKPDYTIVVSESDETSMEQILKILALHKILRDPLKKFSPDKIKTMSERFKKAIKKCSEI